MFFIRVMRWYAAHTRQIKFSLLCSCPSVCVCVFLCGRSPRHGFAELNRPPCIQHAPLHSQVSSKRTVTFLAYLGVYIASVTRKCVELSSWRAASDPALWSSHGRSQCTINEGKHTQIARSLYGATSHKTCVCVCVCVSKLKAGWASGSRAI